MVTLFGVLMIVCIVLVIIGAILWWDVDVQKEGRDLGSAFLVGGILGGIAIYLARRYNLIRFD